MRLQAGDAVRTKLGERRMTISTIQGRQAEVHWYEGAQFRRAIVPVHLLEAC